MNIKEKLLSLLGDLGKLLSVLFKDALQKELKLVLPIAINVVKQVAADPSLLSGGMKREAAITLITDQLISSQKQIGLSVISLAVELAVQNVKTQ